jgi:ankyrin repeat protein
LAIQYGSDIEVIRLLLKNKANIYIKNNNKETSIGIAKIHVSINVLKKKQVRERTKLVFDILLNEGNLY